MSIFSPKKGIPGVSAARLHRWQIIISTYDCEVKYRQGSKNANADGLSRLPLPEFDEDQSEYMVNSFHLVDNPIDMPLIKEATLEDVTLKQVVRYVRLGWPDNPQNLSRELRLYWEKRSSLEEEDGCLFYGFRIVIPKKFRDSVLEMLHEGHIGTVRMKILARSFVWWNKIDKDIETFVENCEPCFSLQKAKPSVCVPWKKTQKPFERIHIDFFHFGKHVFLLLVDSYSKWIEVELMRSTTANKVIEVLTSKFNTFGYPEQICSDNGPPFGSHQFTSFCESKHIQVLKSPPYHPQSNGIAERAVQTVKTALKKFVLDKKYKSLPIAERVSLFLINYRQAPCSTTKISPADSIFTFRPRFKIERVNPQNLISKNHSLQKRFQSNSVNCNRRIEREFKKNLVNFKKEEVILYKLNLNDSVKWVQARIKEIISPIRFIIEVNGYYKYVHYDQIKKKFRKKENAKYMVLSKPCLPVEELNTKVKSEVRKRSKRKKIKYIKTRFSERLKNK